MITIVPSAVKIKNEIIIQAKSDSVFCLSIYCVTEKINEGLLIYNRLTEAIILVESDMKTFLYTDEAISGWFSIPKEYNNQIYFKKVENKKLGNKIVLDPIAIKKIMLYEYTLYTNKVNMEKKRKHLFSLSKIKEICYKYGSPVYVFRENDFLYNYDYIKHYFESIYSKYRVAYSFKTNYTPYVCKIVKNLSGYAEVVSDMELSIARKIGFSENKIIYNGPYKGSLSHELILNGGIVNVDNIDELKSICSIAIHNSNKRLEIGVRVNLDVGQKYISRFGIDADSHELDKAFNIVNNIDNLEIIGIHFHISTRTLKSWSNRSQYILNLADKYFERPPKYIDLGSGMISRTRPDKTIPQLNDLRTIENYANAAILPIAEHYQDYPEREKPYLFTEPGTLMIKNYIDFISQVKNIKNIRGRDFVTLDCSMLNIGNEDDVRDRLFQVIPSNENKSVYYNNAYFVGHTCMDSDEIFIGFNGNLAKGDYIIFGDVGAYSNVKKPPFIAPNCAMISINDNGKIKQIKEKEKVDNILSTYLI